MAMRRNAGLLAGLLLAWTQTPVLAADMPVKAFPAAVADPIDYGNLYFGTDVNTNHGLVGYGGLLLPPVEWTIRGFIFTLRALWQIPIYRRRYQR